MTNHAQTFLGMHQRRPGFILPNAWDPGSARLLEAAGFDAIATTSAGISFAAGCADGTLAFDQMLLAVRQITNAVSVPVNADLESGYGETPADVARSVEQALDAGIAGVNLEDAIGGTQLGVEQAAERISAARSVAAEGDLVINARIDTFLVGTEPDVGLNDAVDRASSYIHAGADCIFLPGLNDLELMRHVTHQVDAPINAVVGLGSPLHDANALWSTGVTRISIGGSLARAAFGVVVAAAHSMRESGTFDFATTAVPHAEMQQQFRHRSAGSDKVPQP